jgi:hypothetical protein
LFNFLEHLFTEEPHASVVSVFKLTDDQRVVDASKFPVVVQRNAECRQLGVDGSWTVLEFPLEVSYVVLDVTLGKILKRLLDTEEFLCTFDASSFTGFPWLTNPTCSKGVV